MADVERLLRALRNGDHDVAPALFLLAKRRNTPTLAFETAAAVGLCPAMRPIPPGEFIMGEPSTPFAPGKDAGPPHRVILTRPLWIAETPVTQGQWSTVMGNNPSQFRGDPRRPVERVTWYEAIAYCNALSRRMALPESYAIKSLGGEPGKRNQARRWESTFQVSRVAWSHPFTPGIRLATEAEWAYVAHRATEGKNHTLPAIAWYRQNSDRTTQPVATRLPIGDGLYDLLGNVSEWVWDRFQHYRAEDQVDPTGPSRGRLLRVYRSGAWSESPFMQGTRLRRYLAPHDCSPQLGFRVVCSV